MPGQIYMLILNNEQKIRKQLELHNSKTPDQKFPNNISQRELCIAKIRE